MTEKWFDNLITDTRRQQPARAPAPPHPNQPHPNKPQPVPHLSGHTRFTPTTDPAANPAADRASCIYAGAESRTDPNTYRWHGLRRGGNPKNPSVLLQYTTAGQGAYDTPTTRHRILPGQLFVAVIPSDHCYYLPAATPSWQFVWLHLHQPYAVQRTAAAAQLVNNTLTLTPDSPLIRRLATLLTAVVLNRLPDALTAEQESVELAFAFERAARAAAFPESARQKLLRTVHQYALNHLTRPISVDDIAATVGLSRSAFSHHFRRTTGTTPAAVITETRLAQAERLLLSTDLPLKDIATRTGHADANHLCKSFRRTRHITPGTFRAQVRQTSPHPKTSQPQT